MFYLQHTCPTPAEDLALDEALLEAAEQRQQPLEVLRIWEPERSAVILGRSSSADVEANFAECRRLGVDVLRRTSGGAAVVLGPGCLMYSVVLSYAQRPHLRSIDEAHHFVLETVLKAVRQQVPAAVRRGTSDLAVGDRKFSGNSLRCRRDHLLYHGTLLYNFPLERIAAVLGTPPRQPKYRGGRAHGEFVGNLNCSREALITGLQTAFAADALFADAPQIDRLWDRVQALADEKYRLTSWNEQL